MINVHGEIFVSLQDQPERRSANYIMLGNGRYTARFGMAIDLCAVAAGIPACSKCFEKLLRNDYINTNPCKQCTAWEMDVKSSILDFDPPEHYPTECIPDNGKLHPIKLSYDVLKEAIKVAHDRIEFCIWTERNAESYLKVHGLNAEIIGSVTEHALNARAYRIALQNKHTKPLEYDIIHRERMETPDIFERWKFPSLWRRGCSIDQHIDVIMHLLLLGIQKTTMNRIKLWHSLRRSETNFIRYAAGILENIQKLNISWCKAIAYKTGKLGGWVSENYLAMARLNKWFYSGIEIITSDESVRDLDAMLNIPQDRWLKKFNVAWLHIRGLDTSGCYKTVKERVQTYMSDPDNIPPIIPILSLPAKNIFLTTQALTAMIAHVMIVDINNETITETERRIKIFLNIFDNFDKEFRDKTLDIDDMGDVTSTNTLDANIGTQKKKPTWISSSNFMCLLNLPNAMRRFGPLRHLFEGTYKGEGYLRLCKPHMKYGLRGNWKHNTLRKILLEKSLHHVRRDNNDDLSEEDNNAEESYTQYRYSSYPSRAHVLIDFTEAKPISLLQFSDGAFGSALYNSTLYVPLRRGQYIDCINGHHYHEWNLSEEDPTDFLHTKTILNYCLLLPLIGDKVTLSNHHDIFTLINENWEEIQHDGSWSLPDIPSVNI